MKTKKGPLGGTRENPPTLTLTCARCGDVFEKNLYTYRADRKRILAGKRGLVKISCHKDNANTVAPLTQDADTWYCSKSCARSWSDRYTPWKHFINNAQSRAARNDIDFEVDLEFLCELWDKQKGICPYTGIKMEYPMSHRQSRQRKRSSLHCASLDRICTKDDKGNKLGYLKNNVELVCLGINLMKNDWPVAEVKEFLKKINPPDLWEV